MKTKLRFISFIRSLQHYDINYATASFLKVLADTMGISKASARRCVHDIAECLCELAKDWINFPTASGDINANKYDL